MERPSGIVWFERIMIATLVLGILNSWLAWPQLVALRGPAFILTVDAVTLAIMLALIFFISRRGSSAAKWIFIGVFALGLPFVFKQLASGQFQGAMLITVTQTVGQIVACTLLFTPKSRPWFRRRRRDAALMETFS